MIVLKKAKGHIAHLGNFNIPLWTWYGNKDDVAIRILDFQRIW